MLFVYDRKGKYLRLDGVLSHQLPKQAPTIGYVLLANGYSSNVGHPQGLLAEIPTCSAALTLQVLFTADCKFRLNLYWSIKNLTLLSATQIAATISYTGSPYRQNDAGTAIVTRTGTNQWY
jgi:hypothetical protein